MNTKHAVVSDDELLINEGGRVQRARPICLHTMPDYYSLARTFGITHLWIMPGLATDMRVTAEYDMFATYEDAEQTRPMFARIYKKGIYGEVMIGWPHNGDWGWEHTDPISTLATIHYLEQVLGVPVEWSPGHMGTELVKHLNRTARRAEWVRDATIDLFELPFKRSARDIVWKTGLEIDPATALYLHQYDKRSAYLSACGDLYVGAGDPVHRVLPDTQIFDYREPGVYRVEITSGTSEFDGETLPAIITTQWITSDVLAYAIKQGYVCKIHECYQWTEKHKTLASYADKLWNSRRVFRENFTRFPHQQGRENAENTMKMIAIVATGKFASEKSGHFQQPYWWAAVVGKARVNMLANIHKIYTMTGLSPALIYSDSVYYVSTEPDARKAVPGILDREDKLGGFRHDGTWRVSPEMIEQFRTQKAGAIQKWLEHAEKEGTL